MNNIHTENDKVALDDMPHDNLKQTVNEKCSLIFEVPGAEVEFEQDEAEDAGVFHETALSDEDAKAAIFDEHPYGKNE